MSTSRKVKGYKLHTLHHEKSWYRAFGDGLTLYEEQAHVFSLEELQELNDHHKDFGGLKTLGKLKLVYED
jgi:hypothetical protein